MQAAFGYHDLTFDEKHRLLIPIEIRRHMVPMVDGDGFALVKGVNKKAWLWPIRKYRKMVRRLASSLTPSRAQLDLNYVTCALARELELDKQGRVLIPEEVRARYNIPRDVSLLALHDHLEIWDRAEWLTYQKQLDENWDKIMAEAPELLPTPTNEGQAAMAPS